MSSAGWRVLFLEEELETWRREQNPPIEDVVRVLTWADTLLEKGPPTVLGRGIADDEFYDRVPYTSTVVVSFVVDLDDRFIAVTDISTV